MLLQSISKMYSSTVHTLASLNNAYIHLVSDILSRQHCGNASTCGRMNNIPNILPHFSVPPSFLHTVSPHHFLFSVSRLTPPVPT